MIKQKVPTCHATRQIGAMRKPVNRVTHLSAVWQFLPRMRQGGVQKVLRLRPAGRTVRMRQEHQWRWLLRNQADWCDA